MQERSTPRDRIDKDRADKDRADRDRAEQVAALQRLLAQARESGISARSMEDGLPGGSGGLGGIMPERQGAGA